MGFIEALLHEANQGRTQYLLVGLVLTTLLVRRFAPSERRRMLTLAVLVALHLVTVILAAAFRTEESAVHQDVELIASALAAMAGVGIGVNLLFVLALPRVGLRVPRILRDVIGAVVLGFWLLSIASRAGINVGGLIATSAVLTAVIGLALQDSIGNVFGGLMLQLDDAISPGDWVKIGDVSGKVLDVRWRFTAVETRNWETLIIPNSQVVKNQVTVLGRRSGQPHYWRRWVWFNVDYATPPTEVIAAVNAALLSAPIHRVSAEPKPHCIMMDLHESYGRYAVRYWLNDIAADDPTDSEVRTRIYFALKRAGISLAGPRAALLVTDTTAHEVATSSNDLDTRRKAIGAIELFKELSDDDKKHLADGLRYAPFCTGEALTRQGAEAHWLYTVTGGKVAVRVTQDGIEKEVAQLGPGSFFGEMSLMTGEPRSATVTALSDVECYRLDKAEFQEVIHTRPELAEHIAEILARRKVGLEAAREDLDQAAAAHRLEVNKVALLSRVREFFGLDEDNPS